MLRTAGWRFDGDLSGELIIDRAQPRPATPATVINSAREAHPMINSARQRLCGRFFRELIIDKQLSDELIIGLPHRNPETHQR